jgi:hypothetical protein
MAGPAELASGEPFDFDGDGDDDLISVAGRDGVYEVVARRSGPDGLGDATTVLTTTRPITGMAFRPVGRWGPVEALITTACDEAPCVARRVAFDGKLVTFDRYRAVTTPIPLRLRSGPR